ncbi:MAG: 2-succinyl-5-enolpyruvyl-6-hydroxy-3-cyclohexene-1-carboxylic-acid synthase [Aquiluna sp.]|nr:2-succinyl-5-enolpyruvyl-6-hydroxy-3-cyclohexene-1-carboxylic-acid synthase [Aquiluna sp.]MCF8545528.1 2-succinyl-5-enolpyruvyl-6-hydroxy-3-cyclohexene-1-carboxylic-acid synthase [Aquiluna sp.]
MSKVPSQVFAADLISEFVALGVTNFFLSPGARSQALAIAVGQLAQAGKVELTVVLDERSMSFAALGRALGSGSPSVLITTSGTAVANLHPAVLEANHSGIPLILLTADRPKVLRNKGANQTTQQPGIFADVLRLMIDVDAPHINSIPNASNLARQALSHALGERPGPVQLNLQFTEPLSAAEPNAAEVLSEETIQIFQGPQTPISEIDVVVDDRTVAVAGAGATLAAQEFAEKANLPLFAEPSSGARFSRFAIKGYPKQIAGPLGKEISRVIVFGKPTLSRAITNLIKNSEVWVQKSRTHGHFDLGSNSLGFADQINPIGRANDAWLASWLEGEIEADSRTGLVQKVWESTAESEQLLFGASELIRKADQVVSPKKIAAFSNRGLSGIDGTIATGLGLSQNGKQTRVLLGDLTFLHDAGSLNRSGFGDLDIQLVVGNDNGGQIFKNLEMAKTLEENMFEKLFLTPQKASIEQLADAYGWKYFKAESEAELEPLLDQKGFVVIEYSL